MHSRWQLPACSVFFGLVFATFAQPQDQPIHMRPATIGTNKNSLPVLLKYPAAAAKKKISASVRLTCRVDHEGKVQQFWARNSSPDSKPLVEEVNRAAKLARFEPAILAGKTVGVEMEFEVDFGYSSDGGKVSITELSAAQGTRAAEGYTPAQRLLTCDPVPLYPVRMFKARKTARLHMNYCIDTDGIVKDIVVTEESPAPTEFSACLTAWLEQLRFIPPFRDGKPVRECYEQDWAFQLGSGV
jgi:TonB family protein